MAIGDHRKSLKLPGATETELATAPPPEPREILVVEGKWELRVGDGVTIGGVPITGGGGGGGGDAFKTIAVEGVDPSLWLQADQVNDVLTIRPLRGMSISPIPGSDVLGIGLPDGGVYGNVPTWVGDRYAPNPIPPLVYEPQPGEIPASVILEDERKLWDGYVPLVTFLPASNPADTASYNGMTLPSMGATGTKLLRALPRVPVNAFEGLSVVIHAECTATTGDIRMVARLAVVGSIAAAPTFEDDALLTVTVPGTIGGFDIEISLADIGAATQGSQVLLEFGRLGDDAADTCAGSIIVRDALLRLA